MKYIAGIVAVISMVVITQGIALLFGVPITVFVDKQEVFSGNSNCVLINPGGAITNTKVEINGGFMCLFPRAQYVSSDVQIK